MNNRRIFFLIIILTLAFLTSFGIVKAQGKGFCPFLEGGLIPCGRSTDDPTTPDICECLPCNLCHIFVLFKRIVDFATLNIVIPLAILMFVVGGVILLTATGNPGRVSQGKKILTATVIGIVIVLIAWLVINTIVFFAANSTFPTPGQIGTILGKPWNDIECPYCGDKICQDGSGGTTDLGENFQNCPYDCMNFLWVPLSGADELVQINLTDGTIIKTYDLHTDNGLDCNSAGSCNPSRLTVMPGSDVWVANRDSGNVTRLSPDKDDLPHYKVVAHYPVGGKPRGITYDLNGDIWVGSCFDATDNFVQILNPEDGSIKDTIDIGVGNCTYGMIGDPFGYVWIANRAGNSVIRIDIDTKTVTHTPLTGDVYGIGMDNEGDIWVVESARSGSFCEIMGGKDSTIGTKGNCYFTPPGAADIADGDTDGDGNPEDTWGDARGIAVDGNNNVWVAASSNSNVYVFNQNGVLLCNVNTGGGPVGVAIDRYNNGWAVEAGGEVDALGAIGGPNPCGYIFPAITVGDSPYNYSDMTGFRSMGCPRPR